VFTQEFPVWWQIDTEDWNDCKRRKHARIGERRDQAAWVFCSVSAALRAPPAQKTQAAGSPVMWFVDLKKEKEKPLAAAGWEYTPK